MPQRTEKVPAIRGLRPGNNSVADMLSHLDNTSTRNRESERRQSDRYAYRVTSLRVDFPQADGTTQSQVLPTRNLSRTGIGIVLDRFAYKGARCAVYLVTLQNQVIRSPGRVVRCRYLSGTPGLHEVGIQFDVPIDLSIFNRHAGTLRLLLASSAEADRRLLRQLMRAYVAAVEERESGDGLVDFAVQENFDLVILDAALSDGKALEIAREMRTRGVAAPLLIVADPNDTQLQEAAPSAGISDVIERPLTQERLEQIIQRVLKEPTVSAHPPLDGPIRLVINSFVERVPDFVRRLELAVIGNQLGELTQTLDEVKADAAAAGFELIVAQSVTVRRVAGENAPASVLRTELNELVGRLFAARPCPPLA